MTWLATVGSVPDGFVQGAPDPGRDIVRASRNADGSVELYLTTANEVARYAALHGILQQWWRYADETPVTDG